MDEILTLAFILIFGFSVGTILAVVGVVTFVWSIDTRVRKEQHRAREDS